MCERNISATRFLSYASRKALANPLRNRSIKLTRKNLVITIIFWKAIDDPPTIGMQRKPQSYLFPCDPPTTKCPAKRVPISTPMVAYIYIYREREIRWAARSLHNTCETSSKQMFNFLLLLDVKKNIYRIWRPTEITGQRNNQTHMQVLCTLIRIPMYVCL